MKGSTKHAWGEETAFLQTDTERYGTRGREREKKKGIEWDWMGGGGVPRIHVPECSPPPTHPHTAPTMRVPKKLPFLGGEESGQPSAVLDPKLLAEAQLAFPKGGIVGKLPYFWQTRFPPSPTLPEARPPA